MVRTYSQDCLGMKIQFGSYESEVSSLNSGVRCFFDSFFAQRKVERRS